MFTTNVDGSGETDVPLGVPIALDGVSIRYFPSTYRRLFYSPRMRHALNELVAGYDAVHLHSVFLWPTYAAARAARRHGVPYIVSPRGMLVPDLIARKSRFAKNLWINAVERRTFASAASVHFTAGVEWDAAKEISIPLPSPVVVPNGIELPPATSTPRLPDTLLFLGRINWKKGLDRLLDAVKAVPGVKIVIAGNDEEGLTPVLQAQAQRNGIADRIDFRGPVSGAEKEELLRTSTALVLPSLSENFGNVVLEAMAVEMPVVVTADVGLAADVASAGAGIVTSNLPEPLAAALHTLLRDSGARAEMGRRGRALVEARFTWERVASQMEELYLRMARQETHDWRL